MSEGVVIALIVGILGALGINFLKTKSNNKVINKLEEDKKVVQTTLDKNIAERETLKEKVTAQEHNATEEHKSEFWDKYTKDDK